MEKLLTSQELADYARVPLGTVRFWRAMETGPHGFRVGKRVVYRESVVEAWLAEREQASA